MTMNLRRDISYDAEGRVSVSKTYQVVPESIVITVLPHAITEVVNVRHPSGTFTVSLPPAELESSLLTLVSELNSSGFFAVHRFGFQVKITSLTPGPVTGQHSATTFPIAIDSKGEDPKIVEYLKIHSYDADDNPLLVDKLTWSV